MSLTATISRTESSPAGRPFSRTTGPEPMVIPFGAPPAFPVSEALLNLGDEHLLDHLMSNPDIEEVCFNGETAPLFVQHRLLGARTVHGRMRDVAARSFIGAIARANGSDVGSRQYAGTLWLGTTWRIEVVLPPLVPKHPTFVLRRASPRSRSLAELVVDGTLTEEAAMHLWCAADGLGGGGRPANVLVVGPRGSGKTTMLDTLLQLVPESERVATVEPSPSLSCEHPNRVRLIGGHGPTPLELVTNALRQRPDRIIIDDVRGKEADALITAMATGHPGSMGSFSAPDAAMGTRELSLEPANVAPERLAVIDLLVVMGRDGVARHGRRYVQGLVEVGRATREGLQLSPLFQWNPRDQKLESTGIPSAWLKLAANYRGMDGDALDRFRTRRMAELREAVAMASHGAMVV